MTKFCGQIRLKDTCDLTDPFYDREVWCRKTVEGMHPGAYNCYAEIKSCAGWGRRVVRSWIIHEDYDDEVHSPDDIDGLIECERLEVGVDTAMFGYFDEKPDMDHPVWEAFDDELDKCRWPYTIVSREGFDGRDGFFTSSGYGDGCYPAMVYCNNDGKVVAACTIFV